jgi:hypothetical protein
MLKLVPIIIVIIVILGSASYNDVLIASTSDGDGDKQPDKECLFDPSLPKCTPGPEGCPQGFSMNAYEQCFPRHEEGCPDGYHSHEDDETGRCIPDEVPCAEGYIINPDYPECRLIRKEHPTLRDCMTEVTNIQLLYTLYAESEWNRCVR